jgi:hypothetical protein
VEISVGMSAIIDVWNMETFDDELRGDLETHADLIWDYLVASPMA